MFPFRRRNAPVAPAPYQPKYLTPPVLSMPYSSPNSDRIMKLFTADQKERLSNAYEMAKGVRTHYDNKKRLYDIVNPPPNPFVRGVYFLDPNSRPNAELLRLANKNTLDREERKLSKAANTNYGLVAVEARGIPRDVVLSHISPFLQPTEQEYANRPRTIYDDTMKRYLEYPTDVPLTDAQERVLGNYNEPIYG